MAFSPNISTIITEIAKDVLEHDQKLHAGIKDITAAQTDTRSQVVIKSLVERISLAIYEHLGDERKVHEAFAFPPISSPHYLNRFDENSLRASIAERVLAKGLDEDTLLMALRAQRIVADPTPAENFNFNGRVPSANGKQFLGEMASQHFGVKADIRSPQAVLRAISEKQGNERFESANSQWGCQRHYLVS